MIQLDVGHVNTAASLKLSCLGLTGRCPSCMAGREQGAQEHAQGQAPRTAQEEAREGATPEQGHEQGSDEGSDAVADESFRVRRLASLAWMVPLSSTSPAVKYRACCVCWWWKERVDPAVALRSPRSSPRSVLSRRPAEKAFWGLPLLLFSCCGHLW